MPLLGDVASPPIVCTISERRSGLQVMIDATIRANATVRDGTYRLLVAKRGPAGNSQVSQGSTFSLEAGANVEIRGLSLSMEPDARYRATLSIAIGPTTYDCDHDGPDPAESPYR